MTEDEHSRSPRWDDDAAAEFESRLRALRPADRPELLRAHGNYLLTSSEPEIREFGRGLLERTVREYPYNFESRWACEQLAMSYASEGRLAESERAFRHHILMCKQSSIGYSGGSGVPELHLAEVLLRMGGRAVDAWELLEEVTPRVSAQNLTRATVYRHLLASARAARELGLPSAAEFAAQALEVAEESEPALPLHPHIGRPQATDEERAELRSIAAG